MTAKSILDSIGEIMVKLFVSDPDLRQRHLQWEIIEDKGDGFLDRQGNQSTN